MKKFRRSGTSSALGMAKPSAGYFHSARVFVFALGTRLVQRASRSAQDSPLFVCLLFIVRLLVATLHTEVRLVLCLARLMLNREVGLGVPFLPFICIDPRSSSTPQTLDFSRIVRIIKYRCGNFLVAVAKEREEERKRKSVADCALQLQLQLGRPCNGTKERHLSRYKIT